MVDGWSVWFGQEVGRKLVGVALDKDKLLVFDKIIDVVVLGMDVARLGWDGRSLGEVDCW